MYCSTFSCLLETPPASKDKFLTPDLHLPLQFTSRTGLTWLTHTKPPFALLSCSLLRLCQKHGPRGASRSHGASPAPLISVSLWILLAALLFACQPVSSTAVRLFMASVPSSFHQRPPNPPTKSRGAPHHRSESPATSPVTRPVRRCDGGWFRHFDFHGNGHLSKSELLRGIVKSYDAGKHGWMGRARAWMCGSTGWSEQEAVLLVGNVSRPQ